MIENDVLGAVLQIQRGDADCYKQGRKHADLCG